MGSLASLAPLPPQTSRAAAPVRVRKLYIDSRRVTALAARSKKVFWICRVWVCQTRDSLRPLSDAKEPAGAPPGSASSPARRTRPSCRSWTPGLERVRCTCCQWTQRVRSCVVAARAGEIRGDPGKHVCSRNTAAQAAGGPANARGGGGVCVDTRRRQHGQPMRPCQARGSRVPDSCTRHRSLPAAGSVPPPSRRPRSRQPRYSTRSCAPLGTHPSGQRKTSSQPRRAHRRCAGSCCGACWPGGPAARRREQWRTWCVMRLATRLGSEVADVACSCMRNAARCASL